MHLINERGWFLKDTERKVVWTKKILEALNSS